jgi:hypothetical protein
MMGLDAVRLFDRRQPAAAKTLSGEGSSSPSHMPDGHTCASPLRGGSCLSGPRDDSSDVATRLRGEGPIMELHLYPSLEDPVL